MKKETKMVDFQDSVMSQMINEKVREFALKKVTRHVEEEDINVDELIKKRVKVILKSPEMIQEIDKKIKEAIAYYFETFDEEGHIRDRIMEQSEDVIAKWATKELHKKLGVKS